MDKNTSKNLSALLTIIAIMSFVLSALLIIQSFKVMDYGNVSQTYLVGGICGILMAIMFIFSGVVAIVLRNYNNEYVPLVCFAIILCGCMLRIFIPSKFQDLDFWMLIMFLYAFIYFFIGSYIKIKNTKS